MGPEKVETETMQDEDEFQWNIVSSRVLGGQKGGGRGGGFSKLLGGEREQI